MSTFPATGYSTLTNPGNWTWKAPPLLGNPEGGFKKVTAKFVVRRGSSSTSPLPDWTVPGSRLNSSDFSGDNAVPVPVGEYYCTGAVITEPPRHLHEIYDVSWIGFSPEQGRNMDVAKLAFPDISGGAVILEGFSQTMTRDQVELPQNGSAPGDPGVIYAQSNLVGGDANVINSETGEYQRTVLLVKRIDRTYNGKAILTTGYLPEPRCTAATAGQDAPDPDGNINLSGTGSGERRLRRRMWWPEKNGAAGGWPLMDYEVRMVDTHGSTMLMEWQAKFTLYREWEW